MATADDMSHLKVTIISWVADMLSPSDPPLQARSKDERGFVNDHTGQLLCLREFSWDNLL